MYNICEKKKELLKVQLILFYNINFEIWNFEISKLANKLVNLKFVNSNFWKKKINKRTSLVWKNIIFSFRFRFIAKLFFFPTYI